MRLTALAQFLSLFLLATCSTIAAEQPPNVVLIFADDLGYGDLGCYGATKVQTPNIDRLAAEGRRFTDAHSVSAVCTPSRYALLTGQYPVRANGGRGVWGPAPITSPLIVDTEKTTIADVFKSRGYDTAVVGKWHLGFGKERNTWKEPLRPGPRDLGFDYYFGMPVVNSAPPYVYVENDRVVGSDPDDPLVYLGRNARGATPITPIPPEAANRSRNAFGGAKEAHKLFNDYQVGTTFAKKSLDWIKARKDKPFFLYLATTNIHHPFTPAKRFQGTSQCGLYGDFIHELDWIVGEILSCLEENGLSDNTLVIFTSDNGGMFNYGGQAAFKAGHRINGDLLGFKFGVWEGGHRVPFIVRWPGKVKAGTTSSQLIGNVDMLATFAELTGQKLGKVQQADSVNMLPAFVDEPEKDIRDHLVLAPHKGTHLSVRRGQWMYIPARGSGGFGGRKPSDHTFAGPAAASFVGSVNSDIEDGIIKKDAPPAQLYDLIADRNQTKNVHDEHPEVVKELSSLLAGYKPKPGPKRPRGSGKPAKKVPATASTRSASFDFESGKLLPWKVVEGRFGHPIGNREHFFHNKGEYNKQGKYYLTTLESVADAEKGMDRQTGVIVSPLFVPEGGKMTFRVGGGYSQSTYVALCMADGKAVQYARGVNDQVMQEATWDLLPYAGKKMFIKIVDQSTDGWGHITVDDFQFDAKVLEEYPKLTPAEGESSSAVPAETHDRDARAAKKSKPNFVLIFTDDQGYADLSCFGGEHVTTPRIDQMAAEGMKLTSFYVAAPLCTPSRAGLMTGCYPRRINMAYGSDFAVLLAGDKKGMNPAEVTIAEVLKSAGYKTGMFGKWHLGDQPEFLPTRQGFDEYFGIPYSHDIHPFHPRQSHFKFPPLPLLDNEKVIEMDPDADHLTRRITERAVKFIDANKDEPFFLYVPHPIPHAPLHVSPSFMADVPDVIKEKLQMEKRVNYKTRRSLFRPAISEIDWSVGKILDALKKHGIDDNTIVMFTSDNGPAIGKATPLRGRKGSTFEGGMREPTVIRWPGMIPAGRVNDEIMTTMDLLPTFAKLAGAKVPADRTIDGQDIWQTLIGESGTPHEAFFYYRDNSLNAVRSGKWKLHLKDRQPAQLCDLECDIGETQNLIKDQPEVVERLVGYVKTFEKNIAADNRPAAFVEKPKPLSIAKVDTSPVARPETATASAEDKTPHTGTTKPNFVIIFTDDQGYQDLGCYGSPDIKTPHIDQMAKEGMRFTSFYAQTVCGPSRASLLTGCYPMRTARNGNDNGRIPHPALSLKEITIPEILKPQGYHTAMFGKWDLAGRRPTFNVDLHPSNQGFDYSFWTQTSGDGPIREGATVAVQKPVRSTLTSLYTDKAIEFIEQNKNEPFFLYLAHVMPHTKLAVSEAFKGKSDGGFYGDVIEEIDHNVGRILTRIKELGLDENTYVIFTSDNGPWWREGDHAGHCEPLRSAKTSTYEGGLRVPFIIRAPGKVPAGTTSDAVSATIDLLPTIAKLTGAKTPDDRVIDGLDISGVFHGTVTELGRPFFYYQHQALRAVRQGDWKLHLPHSYLDRTKEGKTWQTHVPENDRPYIEELTLYNLKEDIGESTNVASDHPEVVESLLKQLDFAKKDIGYHDQIGNNSRRKRNAGIEEPEPSVSRTKPNVIFMLTDDLGYSDIGCYGAGQVKTPHIDRLAAEGVRFTDFHTAASICSPSRAAFLTGAYPQRAGLYMGINPNRTAHWFLGLHPDEITIAEQFQQQGYETHMVGKWHLGTEPEFLPRKQGFDHYYGMPCNYSHSPKFFDNDEEVFAKTPLDRLTQLYTERITSIIHNQANGGKPFFLYYAHNYPHTPYLASSAFKGTSQDGVRGDVMQELDWSVGEMMTALKEAGVAENTIVIFTSDNGPTHNKYALPYRGTKYVTFEGGHRVPFIVYWPARIKEPSVSNVRVNAMDLFPTLSEVIGADLPTDRMYDGESLLPLFAGKTLKRPADDPFYYYNCENLQAVRQGDWKLHLPRSKEQLPFWDKNRAFANLEHPILYNLRTDRTETTNVAADNPEVVRRLMALAKTVRRDLGEFMQRGKSQRPTGSLFPDIPVISHEKDWNTIDPQAAKAIAVDRLKRHPNQKPRLRKPRDARK